MMHQPKLRALTAYFVCFVFLMMLASPLTAGRSTIMPTPTPIRIALGPCVDTSGSAYGDLSAHLASAAQLALATSEGYRVVSPADRPGPERVLHLTLQDISGPAEARPLQVTLAAELRSAASGERICSAAAVSNAGGVPMRTASSEAVVRAAVSSGVQAVVAQVTQAAQITGKVVATNQRDKVHIDLGQSAGIRLGTELAIYRDGQYLATVLVGSVGQRDCVGSITDIKAGAVLRSGDDARVVSIPPKAPKKSHGKSKRTGLLTGIVVLAGLGLLTGLNSWGGHTIPATNVVDPLGVNKTVLTADGTDSITITAIVNDDGGNPVINDTPIIFRITAGRGDLNGAGTQVEARTAEGAATVTLTTVDPPPGNGLITVTAIPRKGTSGMTPPLTVQPPPP